MPFSLTKRSDQATPLSESQLDQNWIDLEAEIDWLGAELIDLATAVTSTLQSDYAPLASPALTGTPTAPTPAASDDSTKLATTAFVQAAVVQSGPLAGFRNAVINGNFDVWQRGTSEAVHTFVADRWVQRSNANSGGTKIQSRQTFTPGQTDVPGEPTYFLRVASTDATASNYAQQKIEDVRLFAGQQVTVSFWAKASKVINGCFVSIVQHFGSGGSSNETVNGDSNLDIGTGWAKFESTLVMPSILGKTIGDGSNLKLRIRTITTGTYDADFAQVQVEPGPVATPFERRPIGVERKLCERYYETNYPDGLAGGSLWTGFPSPSEGIALFSHPISSGGATTVSFKVPKRVIPSITVYSPYSATANKVHGTPGGVVNADIFYVGPKSFGVSRSATSASTPADQFIEYMWTASAEL